MRCAGLSDTSWNFGLGLATENVKSEVHGSDYFLLPPDAHHPCLEINIFMPNITTQIKTDNASQHYNFKRANFDLMYRMFRDVDFNFINECTDINEAVVQFYKVTYNIFDAVVPKTNLNKSKYPQWFTKEIISDIKSKNFHHKFRNISQYHNENFKRLRFKIKSDIEKAHKVYINDSEHNIQYDNKNFWNYINNQKENRSQAQTFEFDAKEISNPTEIANAYSNSKFF